MNRFIPRSNLDALCAQRPVKKQCIARIVYMPWDINVSTMYNDSDLQYLYLYDEIVMCCIARTAELCQLSQTDEIYQYGNRRIWRPTRTAVRRVP
jgi:hypothetical protein